MKRLAFLAAALPGTDHMTFVKETTAQVHMIEAFLNAAYPPARNHP